MNTTLIKIHQRIREALANDDGYGTEAIIITVLLGVAAIAAMGLLTGWGQEMLSDLTNN